MNYTFISFAEGDYYKRGQQRLTRQIAAQGFTDIRNYSLSDIDPEFIERHKDIYSIPWKFQKEKEDVATTATFSGFCIWKPYLILKTLATMADGDILLYMDTEDIITGPSVLKQYLQDKTTVNQGFAAINIGYPNQQWTRRDTFILMNCDTPEYWQAPQIEAGFIGIKKSWSTVEFMHTWLTYNSDTRIPTQGSDSQLGENLPGFIEHRGDQSIYSVLIKKWGIASEAYMSGPQQYGLDHRCNIRVF